MSGAVFANSREISGKATDNESLAAMADVCLSPPSPPAGPIPLPYPNFSKAGDTDKGSKTVKVRGKPAGIKNKSNYKKSKGDEAATRSFGMGVVTHKIQGTTEFMAWSMDVKIEGSNVLRLLDMTTHNHGSPPFNLALTMSKAAFQPATAKDATCKALKKQSEARERDKAPPQARNRPPTTHTAGHFSSGGDQFKMVASSKVPTAAKWDHYSKGLPDGGKKADDGTGGSKMCPPDHEYTRQGTVNSSSRHTEGRMIEDIFSGMPGASGSLGTLKMSIDHEFRDSKGKIRTDNEPCDACQKTICKAVECGLKIILCKGDPPKEKPGCPKDK